jgi:hypothetical protein|nr:MAG TPA: hypothetical protein [Caudoviricetes sp.]
MNKEINQIKKDQTVILFCMLMQFLMMFFQTVKMNVLITKIMVWNRVFIDFEKQVATLIMQLNNFIGSQNTVLEAVSKFIN